ncbi:hypothetical protein PVAND_011104 [Polypedilum vanderplanki]|uniref:Cilia- and flagella-associated protein 58 central coiled coil domain-containing protein n=1 Tax=Polypedilum vanderplanki TaxID=319348 RepID=A0A9J6CIA8_POLVA|nr:hypothetical protein PVAND_011104 [Polypedilum vanderplanki]
MDMEESAEENSNAAGEQYEEEIVPKIITDEVFEEVTARSNIVIRDLQMAKQYSASEDMQKLLLVCQNLRQNILDEKEKIEQMKGEVVNAQARVQNVLKASVQDQEVIQSLKSEIELLKISVDASVLREQIAQEAMNVLREKLEKLQKEAEKYTDRGDAGEDGNAMISKKEGLRERDRMINEIEELQKKVQSQTKYIEELEERNIENEEKIKDLYRQLEDFSNDAFKGKRAFEQISNKLQEATDEKQYLADELKKYKQQAEAEHRIVVQQNMQMLGLRANLDKQTTQNNLNTMKLTRLTADFDNVSQLRDKLTSDLNTKNNILKLKEDENAKFRLENAKIIKSKEILMKKMMTIDASKATLENEILKLKNIISTFEKEREQTKKTIEQAKKYSDGLLRERDLVRKEMVKCTKTINDHRNHASIVEQQIKTLENEIKQFTHSEQKLTNTISKLKKEKEQLIEDLQNMSDKHDIIKEDLNSKVYQINDYKEKVVENQTRLVKTQHDLQSAQADIINLEKELQMSKDSYEELKEKIKLSVTQMEKLKEQIVMKEEELKKSQKHIEKIEKEKQGMKVEINSSLIALQHTKSELAEIKEENVKIIKTLRESDSGIEKLKKQLDNLISEKELITTQITRKCSEIELLNQKINMMQMALDRSNSQYNDRLEDIKLLKIEIKNLRSQRNLLARGIANTADMRQEVLQLNRVLVQERVRSRALENEMTTPMNVHRWRKLNGIDPDKAQLLSKVQSLQKRLLLQTSVLLKKDETIQTITEKVQYLEDFTSKLPSENIKEELMMTRHKLSAHTKKMKAALALSKIKNEDLKTRDSLIEEMRNNLMEVKRQLLNEKKEKNKLLETLREFRKSALETQKTIDEYKICGAGFKMNC